MQFKTAPVGENGKTVIKQSCIYFFVIANKIRVPFSSLIGVPKNGGPNWTKNKKKYKVPNNKEKLSLLNGLVREMNQ